MTPGTPPSHSRALLALSMVQLALVVLLGSITLHATYRAWPMTGVGGLAPYLLWTLLVPALAVLLTGIGAQLAWRRGAKRAAIALAVAPAVVFAVLATVRAGGGA